MRRYLGVGKQGQAQPLTQVVDTQGQRVVGGFYRVDDVDAGQRCPARLSRADSAVPVIEQAVEQRRRCGHATAPLGQGQWRVFMAHQGGQALVGRMDSAFKVRRRQVHSQWQGVDEDAQGPVGALRAEQAPHQHRAEHDLIAPGQPAQHAPPGQVEQAGNAYPQGACMAAQSLTQRQRQVELMLLMHRVATLYLGKPVGQGRLVDVAQHVAEEGFVLGLADPKHGLSHVVTKRYRGPELRAVAGQKGDQLLPDHVQCTVVQGDVMELQGGV